MNKSIDMIVHMNMNRFKLHYIEPLIKKVETWKAGAVDLYAKRAKEGALKKDQMEQYKKNIKTLAVKKGDIEFFNDMYENTKALAGLYESSMNQISELKSTTIKREKVKAIVDSLEKFKIIDQYGNMNQELKRGQQTILASRLKELYKLFE